VTLIDNNEVINSVITVINAQNDANGVDFGIDFAVV